LNTRPLYSRLYPVLLVNTDGSTVYINYHEPIQIIRLPFDLSTLDDVGKKRRLLKRQLTVNKSSLNTTSESDMINNELEFNHQTYISKGEEEESNRKEE
jgi:hypothetical protein